MGIFDKLFGKKQPEQPANSKPSSQNRDSSFEFVYQPPIKSAEPQPREEPVEKEVTIPDTVDGKPMAYHYNDVKVNSLGVPESKIIVEKPLDFNIDNDHVEVIQNETKLGILPENRLAGMVRDWIQHNDPYLAYIASYNEDADSFEIFLAFYTDIIGNFLKRKRDAKLIKLTGKQEDFAFPTVGAKCNVEFDDDKEKYYVYLDGSKIGGLTATAIKYATDHDIEPEDLDVIIASIDYDLEKDRDIISVYIAD